MVRHKVEMGRKIEGNRYIVQPVRRERVGSFQHRVEVVGVPVVANEGENGDPNVSFKGIS